MVFGVFVVLSLLVSISVFLIVIFVFCVKCGVEVWIVLFIRIM